MTRGANRERPTGRASIGTAALTWIAVLGLTLAACSSTDGDATAVPTTVGRETASTSVPATRDTTTIAPPARGPDLDQDLLDDAAAGVAVADGAFLIAVVDSNGLVLDASAGGDDDGRPPSATDAFRIGSITKIFTAIATLGLVDDGIVDLDAPAVDYISRTPVPADVTVRHLLAHRSGIYNVTDDPGFFDDITAEPSQVWTPEIQFERIADRPTRFEAGSRFGYSNTNYLLLGVLIEEVTGRSYHEFVRERIIAPADLDSTYLDGFEDGPEPFDPFRPSATDEGPYDYTSTATAAWAAGGMVSTAVDLHALFIALFDGRLVSADAVSEMTSGDEYGLGVELSDWSDGLIGHSGLILGYGSFVRHSVDVGTTAFFAVTDLGTRPTRALETVIGALANAS